MVKIDGHIDLVFRDGLKNYEALPPADVWDNVHSAISTPRSSAWVFRVAAGVAAMVSIGLLSYFGVIRTSESAMQTLTSGFQIEPEGFEVLTAEPNGAPVLAEAIPVNYSESAEDPVGDAIVEASREESMDMVEASGLNPQLSDLASFERNILDVSRSNDIPADYNTLSTKPTTSQSLLNPVDISAKETANRNRWMLGANISPTYLSTNLKADNNLFTNEGGDESALLSYSGGLSVIYSVGNRLSLQTGIYYSSLGRRVSDITSYSGYANYSESKGGKIFGVSTSTGTIASTNKDIFLVDATGNRITSIASASGFDPDKAGLNQFGSSLRQNFEYIEVPFLLSYKLIDKKVDFNIMGGLAYSVLLDNNVYAVSDGAVVPIGSMEDLAGLMLSSSFGMSMHYALNENFSLNLEPSIRYYMNSDGSLSASNNPFAFGIFSGVYYKF